MNFEFATSEQILFGNGSLEKIGALCTRFGKRVIVISGSGSVSISGLMTFLKNEGLDVETYPVTHEPDIDLINEGIEKGKAHESDFVIGFGGGAVIDTAKAVAAMLTNPGELLDYLEVIGGGQKIPNRPLPLSLIHISEPTRPY